MTIARGQPALASDVNAADNARLQKSLNLSDLTNPATARTNLGLGSIAQQDAGAVQITGGAINSTPIGVTTPNVGAFTELSADDLTMPEAGLRALAAALQNVYLGTLAITQPELNRTFRRTTRTGGLYGKGAGPVRLTLTITNDLPTRLDYRVRNALAPATVLQDWTNLDFARVSGAQVVSPSVSAGLFFYLIDIRANGDSTSIVSTTNRVMVGEVYVGAGQSLGQEFIDTRPSGDTTTFTSLGLAVNDFAWIWAATALNSGSVPQVPDNSLINYPVPGWIQSSPTGIWKSAFAVQFQNQIITQAGVPCAIIEYAVGGTGIATWLPGYTGPGTPHYDTLVDIIETGCGGEFNSFMWAQGYYESRNGNTASNYLSQLQFLFSSLRASFPLSADFFLLNNSICAVGAYGGSSITTRNMVRSTSKAYTATVAGAEYIDGLDIELVGDLVHYSQVGAITFANEWWRASMKQIGLADYGNAGPTITSAIRAFNSAVINLTAVQVDPGDDWVLTGAVANQFVVYPAGTTTGALAVASVAFPTPTSIVITLAAPPTEPAALDIWYRPSPDDATIIATTIRNDYSDDNVVTGRQMSLLGLPTTASIPVVVVTVATISDDDAGQSTVISGTYSNGVLTAPEYSIDQGASWTLAPTPTIGSGAYSFTLPTGFTVGVYSLKVRDGLTFGTGTSNVFSITQIAPTPLPVIANHLLSINMAAPAAHVFTDTGLSVQAVVGQQIGSVSDASGNNNWFQQAVTTQRPVFANNIKNGLPGLYFTGTLEQFLSIRSGAGLAGALKASTGYTILLVWTPTDLADVMTVFAASEKAKTGGYNIIRGAQVLTTAATRASRNSDSVYYQPNLAGSASANLLMKAVNRYTGSAPLLQLAINAIPEASGVPGTLGANPFTALYIGAEGSNGIDQYFLDGYIHQIEVWNTPTLDAVRTDLLNYATAQWGT